MESLTFNNSSAIFKAPNTKQRREENFGQVLDLGRRILRLPKG